MTQPNNPGVFNRQQLQCAVGHKWLEQLPGISEPDESAIDLVLGTDMWELGASVRAQRNRSMREVLNTQATVKQLASEPFTLRRGKIYVFSVQQKLNLPTIVSARATGKSSIGRLDVLTRLLCDHSPSFDEVPLGYSGELFVEVIPNSFDIEIAPGKSSVNQLRLFWGEPGAARVTLREALWLARSGRVLYEQERLHGEDLDSTGVRLGVEVRPKGEVSAYCARQEVQTPVNIEAPKDTYSAKEFWEEVPADQDSIVLRADRFYILASKQRFFVPPELCVECRA
ncbi:MAG: 2'-deoxycytidine 5'-triphosphate deaminase domain-containing protein [Terriglobales bacterium]